MKTVDVKFSFEWRIAKKSFGIRSLHSIQVAILRVIAWAMRAKTSLEFKFDAPAVDD